MGANKTASTSFQTLCKNSQKVFEENSLVFPQYLSWKQHSFAAWMSQKRDIKGLTLFLRSIFNETKTKNCNTTLISGEDFENFLIDTHLANEFELLAKSEGYKNIEWIYIRRDPLDYLLSIYSEMSAYKVVLNLELMAEIILEYGFVSVSANRYNWKFVFDVEKFAQLFKKNVNKNLKVISFENFIFDYVGKTILIDYINELSITKLKEVAELIGIQRKRHSPEKVEFRYIANFLNVKANKAFHENNKQLVDSLISHRIKRNNALFESIRSRFKDSFGYQKN